jgi:hypothetical protein
VVHLFGSTIPPEIANAFPMPVNRWDSAPTVIQILDQVYAHREDFRLTRNEKRYLKSLDVFNRPGYPDLDLVSTREDCEFIVDCILSSAAPIFTVSAGATGAIE